MKKILTTLCALILTITSCHKHEIIIGPDNYVQGTDINKLFNLNLEDIKFIEPIDADKGIKYAINNKAEIELFGETLKYEKDRESKVIGEALLSFIEIYDRGTMLITNKHTSSRPNDGVGLDIEMPEDYYNSDLYIHQSLGLFFIEVKQKNNILDGNNLINIPKKLTDYKANNNLSRLQLNIGHTENGMFVLTPIGTYSDINKESQVYSINNYLEGWNGIKGWNCAIVPIKNHTFDNTSPKHFERPLGLDDSNSRIFIALEGYKHALGTEQSMVADGIKAHYILVVGNNENFKYAIKKSQTTVANANITFNADELKDASPNQLRDIVNALP